MPDPRGRDPHFPDRPTHPDWIRLSEAVQTHDAMAEQLGVDVVAITGVDRESLLYFFEHRFRIMARVMGPSLVRDKAKVMAIYMDAFALGKRFGEMTNEEDD